MTTSQEQILQFCLKNAAFHGWTKKLLKNACKNAGLDENYWQIPFPEGAVDVIDYYTTQANTRMLEGVKLDALKTPEKIKALIKNRLTQHEDEKAVIRSCIAVYALHPASGLAASYRTIDAIWRAAGDTASDWNFYSKRALLAGVYAATLNFWLDDSSKNHEKTWEYLDARLANVAGLGKFMSKLKKTI